MSKIPLYTFQLLHFSKRGLRDGHRHFSQETDDNFLLDFAQQAQSLTSVSPNIKVWSYCGAKLDQNLSAIWSNRKAPYLPRQRDCKCCRKWQHCVTFGLQIDWMGSLSPITHPPAQTWPSRRAKLDDFGLKSHVPALSERGGFCPETAFCSMVRREILWILRCIDDEGFHSVQAVF